MWKWHDVNNAWISILYDKHEHIYHKMSSEDLSQEEANNLISTDKYYLGDDEFLFPSAGKLLEFSLVSTDHKEYFQLSIRSGRIDLQKISSQPC